MAVSMVVPAVRHVLVPGLFQPLKKPARKSGKKPQRISLRRAVTYMKGLLAPFVTRVAEAAAEGASEGAHDWATTAVESLGSGMSAAFPT
jgi:hypothetical protein